MLHRLNQSAIQSSLGVYCSLAIWISVLHADQEAPVLVPKPESAIQAPANQLPVLPPPAQPAVPNNSKSLDSQQLDSQTLLPPPASSQLPPTQPHVKSAERRRPFMMPAQPRGPIQGELTTGPESIPVPVPGATLSPVSAPVIRDPNVRPMPRIVYDTDHDARKMLRAGQIQLVVVTQDPSDGSLYEIPLCIPACCTSEPKIADGKSLLGRGVVEYRWPSGFKAKIKFRHLLGDIKVEYEGD